ncbi:hypothetical protein SAMN03159304_01134 [Pseudomonas sp. NFACC24-1]|uniref:hypothetical protein n=1 Tax=Pseudomonas sp. NFACC24-1 TaxID=1566189 RepID=UPI0008F21008|nr:hypothetical protein [Pseudomonas sp. NFACC24-1]SFN83637.1 hypothetical protein SAMN03159304_01134 [Pseudomonas sp. NFACC24-1]
MSEKKPIKKSGSKKPSTKEKIAKLHQQIERLQIELEEAAPRRAGQIAQQLRLLKESLMKERVHLISKLERVRRVKVSGSYGSAQR